MTLTILGAGQESAQKVQQKYLAQLIRVGGRLAVLGVDPRSKKSATVWWHVAEPGTWNAPQGSTGYDLMYATSLCRRKIVTNGYAADFRPADKVLCPACKERL